MSTSTTHHRAAALRNAYMTDELQAIYDQTVDFVAKEVRPVGDAWEREGRVPREVLAKMGSLGMLSLRVPVDLGGLGMGMLTSAVFSEALGASTFAGFDVTVLVHTDMAGPHLVNSGNDDQHARYLPGVLSGELILSIGVTEADAGSDVAGIRTSATRDGDGWRINGSKMFITNAVYGDMTIIAARTDPLHKYGISMFLVPAGTEGFTVSRKLDQIGWLCSDTAELVLNDVWVSDAQLLGHAASRLLRDHEELPERADGARRYGRGRSAGSHRHDQRLHPAAQDDPMAPPAVPAPKVWIPAIAGHRRPIAHLPSA